QVTASYLNDVDFTRGAGTMTFSVRSRVSTEKPGESMYIGMPGFVGGSTTASVLRNSLTLSPPGTRSSFVNTTQCVCQLTPSLLKSPSPFSSQSGVSSKSGCDVTASATMPPVCPKPTSVGFSVVGNT